MSQKKVDAYKARKGLHNKTDRKEKVLFGLEMFAWAFICVVIVAWIGYSAYVKVTGAKETVVQNTVMDTTALDNYISNLSTDASDGTDSTDADTAEEEDTTASTDTDSEDADAADTTADDSDTETADKCQIEIESLMDSQKKSNKKSPDNPGIFLRFNPYRKVRNSILSR